VREGTSQRLTTCLVKKNYSLRLEKGASQTYLKTKLLGELIHNFYDTSPFEDWWLTSSRTRTEARAERSKKKAKPERTQTHTAQPWS